MGLRDWARSNAGKGRDLSTLLSRQRPAPEPEPAPAPQASVAYTPAVQPVYLQLDPVPPPGPPPRVQAVRPIPRTCQLVKPGPSVFDDYMATVPNAIVPGLPPPEGDAMSLAGEPVGAVRDRNWSSTARRAMGGSDEEGRRRLEEYLQTVHGVDLGSIRQD